ncbi:type II secretion system protein GspK [Brevundimonas sp. NIBR11]|uniref:type II secretion system protein GspK n=1 Tax=Brevundimonas sp. NIBR11 TaxID=3015999 RepID=UPI0022EFE400|nr:type II secretion system protein GspK [Brevundimonas sp. NIBR11]WGM30523.1 Type II secretion system protein K [Brevundimonas sp. NIBR11]
MRPRLTRREGMILLNVLLVLAVASVAVLIMVSTQDIEVQRSTRLRDAAQANAYARAGELSAITTLRRDALVAAGTDNLSEDWAKLGQQEIAVPGGRFALSIADDQSRFNLNSMHSGESAPIALFQAIGAQLGVEPASLIRIATVVRVAGPLSDDSLIVAAGVPRADLDKLAPWVVLLPEEATINLNTVGLPLLSLMTKDPEAAGKLIEARNRRGFLMPADLSTEGAPSLPGTGFTSDHFRVVTTVTVGDVTQALDSRIARVRRDRAVDVVVTGRRRAAG